MECLKIRHVLLFTDLGHSNTLCSHMQISVSILWYCVLDNGPLLSQKEYKVQYPMLGRPHIPSNYYSFWYSIFLISNPCSVLLFFNSENVAGNEKLKGEGGASNVQYWPFEREDEGEGCLAISYSQAWKFLQKTITAE